MDRTLLLVVVLLSLMALGIGIWRATELFVVRSDRGRVRLVRGRLPKALLADVRDVLERSRETGKVRVTVWRRAASVNVSGGISPFTAQRLRNVIGAVPLQRIRAGGVGR